MARQHGITANTTKRFIIDAGAVYTGFTSLASPGTLLGATRGGSSFAIEQEIKDMEVDGARGKLKGARRITMVNATLTVNFLEHTLANLKRLIVGATSAVEDVDWERITRDLALVDGDYLSDITIVGEVSGSANGVAIQVLNVLQDGNFESAFEDKEEGVITATFSAHFDPADLATKDDTEPWAILWPNEA